MPKNKNTVSPAVVGPIVVSETNPRYFTIKSKGKKQKALYLTGSHIWNNFQDGMGPGAACSDTPEQFDYDAYLEFLNEHGHNFIRLWRWEQFRSQAAGGGFHLCMTPQPWARTGPGNAKDGKPKFDLNVFDPSYFIDFKFEDSDPIKLVGAPAACKMQFQRPNDGTANAQRLNENNFMNGDNSNYGAMFANKIMVDCP